MILAGNISATEGQLGIFNSDDQGLPILVTEVIYACKDYPNLDAILTDFWGKHSIPEPLYAACFGISGPIKNDCGEIGALQWTICQDNLSKLLTTTAWGCPNISRGLPVELVNNTQLASVDNLDKNGQLVDLNPNAAVLTQDGVQNRAWIAPTNGLGEALFYWDDFNNQFNPLPSEGGHANFAPRTPQEIELLSYLLKKFAPVSYDQILSRKGLVNIYQFLSKKTDEMTADKIIQEALANATDKTNVCTQTLDLFISILGAEAGNLALKYCAWGGVYVGGAIVPNIVDKLKDGTFMKAFTDRQEKNFADLTAATPVKVVTNPKIMLFGAAQRALDKEMMGKALYAQCQK